MTVSFYMSIIIIKGSLFLAILSNYVTWFLDKNQSHWFKSIFHWCSVLIFPNNRSLWGSFHFLISAWNKPFSQVCLIYDFIDGIKSQVYFFGSPLSIHSLVIILFTYILFILIGLFYSYGCKSKGIRK